jgi:multiple sugar transport system ATP-binding protein
VEKDTLYIGEDAVMKIKGVEDKNVYVAIRPEGFELNAKGKFVCELSNVEVMGRDVSVVSRHPAMQSPVIRSIVDADNKIDTSKTEVKFSLKPHKVFLFNKETEERIYFEV